MTEETKSNGWFDTGYDGRAEAEKRQESNYKRGPHRFWLKTDTKRRIAFIDDGVEPFEQSGFMA